MKSTLLEYLRSAATCRNAGPHSGEREIHGKDGPPVRFRRASEGLQLWQVQHVPEICQKATKGVRLAL